MELKAQRRDLKESLQSIRKAGNIPAVFYGHKTQSTPIVINVVEFNKIYSEVGRSNIFSLDIDGEKIDLLVKAVDYHPVKDTVVHVDFYVPTKGQEMEAEVPVEFKGIPLAEKAGNIINKVLLSIKIKTLPKNLPDHIEVNIDNLENIGDTITLADISLPKGVSFITEELTETVVNVIAPKTAEEEDESNSEELEIPKEEGEENKD